jgi:hypothetical protein
MKRLMSSGSWGLKPWEFGFLVRRILGDCHERDVA